MHFNSYVNDGCSDFGAAGTSQHQTNFTKLVDKDGWSHRGQRPFARFDKVGRTRWHVEGVGHVWRRKVVHLVVQNDTRLFGSESSAETSIQNQTSNLKNEYFNRYESRGGKKKCAY